MHPALLASLLLLCAAGQPAAGGGPTARRPAPATPPQEVHADAIPPREHDAFTGTEFGNYTVGWRGRARQAAAVEELLAGNVPEFLRDLVPVTLSHTDGAGTTREATIWVMPDYLSVGADDDFLYLPLTMPSATTVAREWGFVLPTCKMVDAIYAQAAFQFSPIPMEPGPRMRSSVYYLEHQRRIDEQRPGMPLAALVSGHKKDVVLSGRLTDRDDRIAIYGWHWSEGDPIQPLSTVHGYRYADYSHGVRLVWEMTWIDGQLREILDVLEDPTLAPILTYEGTILDGAEILHEEGEPWPD